MNPSLLPFFLQVNVGDLLESWSNGVYPATKHRVVVPASEVLRRCARQSFVYFVHPDDEVVCGPIREGRGGADARVADLAETNFVISFADSSSSTIFNS